MGTDVVVFLVHLTLDVQVEDTFQACCLDGGRHSGEHCVGFDMGEVLVHQAVGGDDGLARHDGAFGESGPVADPDVLAEDDGLGQRSDFAVAVEVLHVMEGRVHELAVPGRAHIAADDDPVEAENLEVGAEIDFPFAELQGRVVGDHHVGAVAEDGGTVEDDGAAHIPDALLDGGVHVMVVLPDFDHPGGDGPVDDDFSRQAAEGHLPVQPHGELLRHRKGKRLEVEPDGFQDVDGTDDVE